MEVHKGARRRVPHHSLRAAGPRRRERRNLTADSKAINHKAINVTPWNGYATFITYMYTLDLYNPASNIQYQLSSWFSVLQSYAKDSCKTIQQGCSRPIARWQSDLSWVLMKIRNNRHWLQIRICTTFDVPIKWCIDNREVIDLQIQIILTWLIILMSRETF